MTARAARQQRIAVLASGDGSNLGAILAHFEALAGDACAAVTLVASDRAQARALERAKGFGIPAIHLGDPTDGAALTTLLADHGIDLIALAGYLRLIPPRVTQAYRGRMMNVHPTLLPAFGGPGMYGLRAHRAVIASGVRVSGVSVHFVDEEYDRGALIAQWPVPVIPGESAESLAARVLRVEHLIYPRAVDAVARGSVRLESDGRVRHDGAPIDDEAMFLLGGSDPRAVARAIDSTLG